MANHPYFYWSVLGQVPYKYKCIAPPEVVKLPLLTRDWYFGKKYLALRLPKRLVLWLSNLGFPTCSRVGVTEHYESHYFAPIEGKFQCLQCGLRQTVDIARTLAHNGCHPRSNIGYYAAITPPRRKHGKNS